MKDQRQYIAKQRRLLEQFGPVPIGTPVLLTKDNGEEILTKTRSLPYMLGEDGNGKGGHTAVIFIEGITGCYALERVRKI